MIQKKANSNPATYVQLTQCNVMLTPCSVTYTANPAGKLQGL